MGGQVETGKGGTACRAPKMDTGDAIPTSIWQARVNRDWRFYFVITGETYLILNIIPHPK
ncbi:MAG: hypothetical protein LAO31_20165 [Acidobacteriia bacterium]|nr:hypothetical protein [Terriglobia bacterium]